MRIRTAHFPAVKTLEEFNLDHLPSLRRDVLAHLATGDLRRQEPRTWSCSARPVVVNTARSFHQVCRTVQPVRVSPGYAAPCGGRG